MKNRDKLITENLGLVKMVLNSIKGITDYTAYDDLYQAGCEGLIKAASRFDESKGFQFSTFASQLIRYAILDEMRNNHIIACPISQQAVANIYAQSGLDFSEFIKEYRINELLLTSTLNALKTPVSLEAPVLRDKQEEISLKDLLTDYETPEDIYCRNALIKQIEDMMNQILTEREREIMKSYYGFGRKRETQREIAYEYHMSRSRIEQIIKKATQKMRSHYSDLEDYVYER